MSVADLHYMLLHSTRVLKYARVDISFKNNFAPTSYFNQFWQLYSMNNITQLCLDDDDDDDELSLATACPYESSVSRNTI